MGAFDQTARRAAKLRPLRFLTWILPRFVAQHRFLDWHDTRTVPFPGEPDRICDTVAEFERLGKRGERWLVDVELQAEPDAEILERIGEYALRLRRERRHGRRRKYRVASVVINLTGPPQASVLDMSVPSLDGGHRLQAVTITIRDEDAAATLSRIAAGELDLSILPWIPLMRGAKKVGIIDQWCELASAETEDRLRSDYPGLALVFAKLAGHGNKWKQRLEGFGMRESQVVLEWQRDAEIKLARKYVIELLKARTEEEIPDDLQQLILRESDSDVLSKWHLAAGTVDSISAFREAIANCS